MVSYFATRDLHLPGKVVELEVHTSQCYTLASFHSRIHSHPEDPSDMKDEDDMDSSEQHLEFDQMFDLNP